MTNPIDAPIPAYRIEFEDHGQDFLEWITDAEGRVLESTPFQTDTWSQFTVWNLDQLRLGGKVLIKQTGVAGIPDEIKYPIQGLFRLDAPPPALPVDSKLPSWNQHTAHPCGNQHLS